MIRERLEDLGWWFKDLRARATFRSRMKRVRRDELIAMGHEFLEYWLHLESIDKELGRLVEVLDARLEHLIIVTGGPRHG